MHTPLIFIILTILIAESQQTGQWTSTDLDSSQMTTTFSEIQQYTISQLSSLGIIPSDFQYKSNSNVYTQVVAGMNWKFDLIYSKENEERTISVIVWQKLPNAEEKFKLNHVSISTSNRNDGINSLGGWTESIDENFDDLKRIFDFGLKNLGEKAKETQDLKFVKVEKLQTQIVHGTNYKFFLQFQNEQGEEIRYQMTIWVKETQMSFASYSSDNTMQETESFGNFLGGWTEIDPDNLGSVDEKTLKYASNGVIERMGLNDFYFLKLEKAMSQVVAGIKYDYVMVLRNDALNQEKKYEIIIWKKLDGFNTENESFEIVEVKELK